MSKNNTSKTPQEIRAYLMSKLKAAHANGGLEAVADMLLATSAKVAKERKAPKPKELTLEPTSPQVEVDVYLDSSAKVISFKNKGVLMGSVPFEALAEHALKTAGLGNDGFVGTMLIDEDLEGMMIKEGTL